MIYLKLAQTLQENKSQFFHYSYLFQCIGTFKFIVLSMDVPNFVSNILLSLSIGIFDFYFGFFY